MNYGKLNIHVVSDNSGFPIPDATVQITSENEPENIIEEAVTNNVGQLNDIELAAPPVDYSMTPSANKPYSEYTITISASGFESVEINGAEIFYVRALRQYHRYGEKQRGSRDVLRAEDDRDHPRYDRCLP